MDTGKLDAVLMNIGDMYQNIISPDAINYLEISIGKQAQVMDFPEDISEFKTRYEKAFAVVPLKQPLPGMKVMIDGRTFVDYAQFENGVAIPGHLARKASLPHTHYTAPESMILNFH